MNYKQIADTYFHPIADKTGYRSINHPWSIEYIIRHLLIVRTSLLKEMSRLGIDIPKENYQTFCLKMIEAEKIDCPCAPPKGCIWMRSEKKLPRYIKDLLVTNISGDYIYSYESWESLQRSESSRIPAIRNSRLYTIKNGYLILPLDVLTEVISISGLFEDPYEAESSSCNATTQSICNPLLTNWATDQDTTNNILMRTWQTLPNLRNTGGIDLINNDSATS